MTQNISKFTQSYLSYRKRTETGSISDVERLPAGSSKSGKTHPMLHFCKIIMGQASAMVKHEERILDYLTTNKVPHTVKLLDYQNSPNQQEPEHSTQTIVTQAVGVDLDDWFGIPIFIHELNRSLSHIYDHPLFVLAILKGSLVALQQIHQHGIIHCDIKLDNICLPYEGDVDTGEPIGIQLDNITLIDFGVSCWLGNIGNNHKNWLGYNEKEDERYQSRHLISILKQWFQDNGTRQNPPYDNSSLHRIDYSCDLYGLGIAFEYFAYKTHQQETECWSMVNADLQSIIAILKSYDNGIPHTQTDNLPHSDLIQKLDKLIQQVIAYEHTQGLTINPHKVHGKIALSAPAGHQTPPRKVPTPTPPPLGDIGLSTPPRRTPTPTPPVNNATHTDNNKKSSKMKWVIGGVAVLVAVILFAVLSDGQVEKVEPAQAIEADVATEQPINDTTAQAADETEQELNALDRLAQDSIDYSQFKLIRTINVSESSVQSVSFSPDSQHIATASDPLDTVQSNMIFNVADGKKIREFESGNASIVYFKDQKYIATASSDESGTDENVSIYSLEENRITRKYMLKESEGFLDSVAFSPSGTYLVSLLFGKDDSDLKVRNLINDNEFKISNIGRTFSFAKGFNSTDIIAVTDYSSINIIDLKNKDTLLKINTDYGDESEEEYKYIDLLEFSHNAKLLATLGSDGKITMYKTDVKNGSYMIHSEINTKISEDSLYSQKMIFTPDGLYFIHKNLQSLDIYRTSDMKKIHTLKTPETWSIDISPDGKYIAAGTSYPNGRVLIYGIE